MIGAPRSFKKIADKQHAGPAQQTATYVIEDLCLRDEYVESLRDEIQKVKEGRSSLEVGEEQLPLLDSFMKESIRFTNADARE